MIAFTMMSFGDLFSSWSISSTYPYPTGISLDTSREYKTFLNMYKIPFYKLIMLSIKLNIMERKSFILSALLATPLVVFPNIKRRFLVNKKAFKINSGKSRSGEIMRFKGMHPNDLKVSANDTGGQFSFFEYTGLAKVGPPMHLHFNQDEIFYVVEGAYKFAVGEETQILQAGDTIFLPRNIPHSYIQLSSFGKLTYMLQPSGKIEEFFRTMNDLAKPPTEEEAEKIYLEHDMKIVGPPLAV